jgi:CheY-like chemotaxis protein
MKMKVLVVEDDFASLELLCEALSATGVEVQGTRSSVQAVAMIEDQKFDGIFLDLTMPGLDGLELSRRIRKSEGNSTTPIIVVSGRSEKDTMKEAFASGAQFYLAKPLDRMKLKRLVNTTQGTILQERLSNYPVAVRTQLLCRSRRGDFPGEISQISEKGLVFQFDGLLHPGDSVQLSFRLPSTENSLEATATVLRIMRMEGRQKAGCRFETLNPKGKQALREFVSAAAAA